MALDDLPRKIELVNEIDSLPTPPVKRDYVGNGDCRTGKPPSV